MQQAMCLHILATIYAADKAKHKHRQGEALTGGVARGSLK